MKNTIEVDKDEEDEEFMLEMATIGPKIIAGEVDTDSIEFFED